MRIEIEVAGTTHDVTVDAAARGSGRVLVSWNGATREVDARVVARDANGVLLSLVQTGRDARSAEVRCRRLSRDGAMTVRADGVAYDVVINGRRARVATGASDGVGAGASRVTAPMPGKVVRVLVAVGDEVVAQQPLVVIEAMKMENELTAARAGTVAEVAVGAGDSVEAGRLLVMIE